VAGSREHVNESSGSKKAGNLFIIETTIRCSMELCHLSALSDAGRMQTRRLIIWLGPPENALGPFFSFIHIIIPCTVRIICVLYNVREDLAGTCV
jgi:hypothetical protein